MLCRSVEAGLCLDPSEQLSLKVRKSVSTLQRVSTKSHFRKEQFKTGLAGDVAVQLTEYKASLCCDRLEITDRHSNARSVCSTLSVLWLYRVHTTITALASFDRDEATESLETFIRKLTHKSRCQHTLSEGESALFSFLRLKTSGPREADLSTFAPQSLRPNPGPCNGSDGLLLVGERCAQLPRTATRQNASRARPTQTSQPAAAREPLRRSRGHPTILVPHPLCIPQRHNSINIERNQIHIGHYPASKGSGSAEPRRTRL